VLWAGLARPPFTAIFDTPIPIKGVQPPAAVAAPDGSIHALISGQKVNSNSDPYAGLNEAVGPGPWKLGARAFGRFSITVPSNADVGRTSRHQMTRLPAP
jgi:hypothetical protein